MKKINIVTTDLDSAAIIRKYAHHETVRWVYLSRNYRGKRQLAKDFDSKFVEINIAEILNKVADEIRYEFVAWVDTLNRNNGGRLSWWFGALSSRNIYTSNIFLYSCYILTLRCLWGEVETRPDLVIVDSPGLAKTVKGWLQTNIEDLHISEDIPGNSCFRSIRSILQYTKSVFILFVRYVAALVSGINKDTSLDKGPWVVVDTYLHDYSLAKDGTFKDRYYPLLHEFLAAKGHRVLVHPVLYGFNYNYSSVFARMRKSATNFIVQEDYLRIADYLMAIFAPFALLRTKIASTQFQGINIDPIVQEEQIYQPFPMVIQAMLSYRLWRRLSRDGKCLSWVICWYENQVIDKALIAGVRDAYPGIEIIGAQMFMHSPNFLNLYPSQSEYNYRLVPDLLLQTGPSQCKAAQKYVPAVRCITAAALRYSHLFAEKPDTQKFSDEKKAILVLLTFNVDESLEILDIMLDALHEIKGEEELLIKCHPDFTAEEIVAAFGREEWPAVFKVCEKNLTEAFATSSMVIASNSSSMVEAAVLGIPVIYIGRQCNLNLNPLAEVPSAIYSTCYDGPQVAEVISRYRSLSSEERSALIQEGKSLKEEFFTAVDDESLQGFLN